MLMYLKIYGEAARDYALVVIPGWIAYNIVVPIMSLFSILTGLDIDAGDIELIAKVFGILVGAISSFFVIRHVRAQTKNVNAQTKNVNIDNLKKAEEIKKLQLENLRIETELENERKIAEIALLRMKKEEENGEDIE